MAKRGKKRELISRYDQSDISDSEIEYRTENLSEFEYVLEMVMDKLDKDIPSFDKLKQLYDNSKYVELAKALTSAKETAKIVEDVVSTSVYEDYEIHSLYWRDEQENIRADWMESDYSGYFRLEDDSDYKYFKDGVDLLQKTIEGHRSDDYEMWREPDGSITIGVGSRSYTYIRVEEDYKDWLGKCVIDRDNNIYKLKGYDAYDGSHAEFTACCYDPESKILEDAILYVTERDFQSDDKGRVYRMTLKDAVHVRRVLMSQAQLSDMGLELGIDIINSRPQFAGRLFDLMLSGVFSIPDDLKGRDLILMLNVLSLLKSGKGYITNLPSKDNLQVRMFDILLQADEQSYEMVNQAHKLRRELVRSIAAARYHQGRRFTGELSLAA